MRRLVSTDIGNRPLLFGSSAVAVFDRYRLDRRTESGGVLLGRVYASEIEVEAATEPTVADRAGPTFFERSTIAAQALVDQAWARSRGEQIYLGEWHSHPTSIAIPSSRDRRMILNNLDEAKMAINFLILVVIGWTTDWIGIAQGKALRRIQPSSWGELRLAP